MARTRAEWTAIACKRSSDDPEEVITVEVMEDSAALPRGTQLRIDRPACGAVRTFVQADGGVVAIDLEDLEEVAESKTEYVTNAHGYQVAREAKQ